jgi:Protein of unknown function (DUF4031)
MTVYVDDMHLEELGRFRHMQMCHMIADTDQELHAMAERIGMQQRWHQKAGTARSHYDIPTSLRALAVQLGAVEITMRQAACMTDRRAVEGVLGSPEDVFAWRLARYKTSNSD